LRKPHVNIHVFLPCHNRCDITVEFVLHFLKKIPKWVKPQIHVLDDGSSDGTDRKVSSLSDYCIVHKLDGTQYWGGSLNYILSIIDNKTECDDEDLVLVANDDIKFIGSSLKNGIALVCQNLTYILIRISIDVPFKS